MTEIKVTSHVGRDLIQASQLFRSPEAAIWEYVVNSLEYVKPGVQPKINIQVDQRNRRIRVSDNGRGMDIEALQQFFTMHGENPDRRKGIPGRGKFGTGKSAAFGIGKRLEVDSVRSGKRNVVELTRAAVEASDGSDIPTTWLVKNEKTDRPDGTIVTIDQVRPGRISTEPLIRKIERHLAFWRAVEPLVYVGVHRCEPWEPESADVRIIAPNTSQKGVIGDTSLELRISRTPLEVGYRGIAITAGPGNLIAIETAGVDTKEFGNYLFGSIDCPLLDVAAEDGTIAAFDSSRSLTLNYEHPVAAVLVGFIGAQLEAARKELVEKHREERKAAQAKELDKAAAKIADLLNEDLLDVAKRLKEMRNIQAQTGVDTTSGPEVEEDPEYAEGDTEPGLLDDVEERPQSENPRASDGEEPRSRKSGEAGDGPDTVSPTGKGQTRKKRGGLTVRFANLGADEERSLYDFESKAILINLDHPAVSAALGTSGVEDVAFQRLAYEIAFTQYALAVAREIYQTDPAITPDDVLFEVRDALRRITVSSASLYAA